ncbi:MAG: hypothetical protein RR646_02230 [Erysipelotrichaceae bacterium]
MKEQFRYVMYAVCAFFGLCCLMDAVRFNLLWALFNAITTIAVYGIIKDNKDAVGLFMIIMAIMLLFCFMSMDMLGIIKFVVLTGLVIYYVYLSNDTFRLFKN